MLNIHKNDYINNSEFENKTMDIELCVSKAFCNVQTHQSANVIITMIFYECHGVSNPFDQQLGNGQQLVQVDIK